jgi:hypothetical protein
MVDEQIRFRSFISGDVFKPVRLRERHGIKVWGFGGNDLVI